ncbi:magnesium/cobalt transporter CorA [Glutamicibacter creatinolyticus]|uniref:magnesium/cobalt transporter CorA n=1 Tax=Glutamicibacter creatinolyticus TaxID=162496 RepID=UPI003B985E32
MTVIDNVIYVAGKAVAHPQDLDQTFEVMRRTGGMGWIGLYRPTEQELQAVSEQFSLHSLAVEDTLKGHQRPKLDRYEGHLFMVLRPARYLDDVEEVEFGEVHIYAGDDFVVTVRHAESPRLATVRRHLQQSPQLLASGPAAVLYAIVDQVIDEYFPVIDGLQNDIDEIDEQLFQGNLDVSRRIYELSREVIDFQRAVAPLPEVLEQLRRLVRRTGMDRDEAKSLDANLVDVIDHAIRCAERVESFRALLSNALSLSATLASQRATETGLAQNEQMKRISSWAAILFTPSLIGAIYGMNFEIMPELEWSFGYPYALGLMVAAALGLYLVFKKNKWL